MKNLTILFSKKRNLKTMKISAILFVMSFVILSCSSDDDGEVNNAITVQDVITMTIDENPEFAQIIGTISASSNSPLTFTLIQQSLNGALTLNSSDGTVTVGDVSSFDFETNPVIEGVVEISNGIEMVTTQLNIDLNNMDDIAFFLTDSRQDYENAQAGEWIEVTEEEYNNLAVNLNEVAKIATSDADYNNTALPSTISTSAADNTIANNNGVTMPTGSYLFAFKYISGGVTTGMRAKQSSTDITTGYENIGGDFPTSPASGDHYLVLKTSNVPTTDVGYLAMYAPIKTFRNYPSAINNSGIGNTNALPDLLANNLFLYQGLSTTQRQWD